MVLSASLCLAQNRGTNQQAAPKMASALLQLQDLVVHDYQKRPEVSTKSKNVKKPITKTNAKAMNASLPVGNQPVKNVDIFVVEDSKMEIVKTKPGPIKGSNPVEVRALKAALGIDQ